MYKKLAFNIKEKYFEFSLYFLISSLFLGNAVLSIAYVTIILLSVTHGVKIFRAKDIFKKHYFLLSSSYFFINLSIVIILNNDLEDILKVEKLLPFVLFPIIFFSKKKVFTEKFNITKIFKVFVFSAFFSFLTNTVCGIYRFFFESGSFNSIYLTYNHFAEPLGVQPIYLSVFYLLAIVFCIDLIKYKPLLKNIYTYISFCLFFGIILLSSRTSLVLSVVIISFKLFTISTNKKNILIIISTLLLLGISITFYIPTLKNRIMKFDQNISSYSGVSFRIKIWNNAFEVFKESPIIGHGFYKSQSNLMEQYKKTNFRRAYMNDLNVHNQYIQALVDSGIIGLTTLFLMLFTTIFNFKRNSFNHNLFTIIIIISLIPESFFMRQYGIIFYCLFNSIFYTFESNKIVINSP